ncbi:MAG: hypothetical protein QOK40_202 [Miltoncostaeaceae bacterium]|jgi:hypothetical protein|nr:hypothetical protein [Miltoncostaeaceae bacterium]
MLVEPPPDRSLHWIAHQLRDHLEHLRVAIEGVEITGAARQQLIAHIAQEESESLKALDAIPPGDVTDQVRKLRFHVQAVHDIAIGREISPRLGLEMLCHFEEEHGTFFGDIDPGSLRAPDPPGQDPGRPAPGFTVGSLIAEGEAA